MVLLLVCTLSTALAGGPVIAPGVNSSRVVPGGKVKSMEMATKVAGVKTVSIGTISGPYGKRFTDSLYASLRYTKQGQYKTGADVGAGAMGGLGQLAAVASGGALSSTGIPGAGLAGNLSEKLVGDTTDKVAERLDGIDRHPAEGFGIVRAGPTTGDRIRETAERVEATGDKSTALKGAAKVASAAGFGQAEAALDLTKDVAKVGAAFFREGVEGNSPPYSGVKLPISVVEDGKADAVVNATISQKNLPDKNFKKKKKKKKRDKNGKVIKDKNGKPIWITVEVPCIKRVVELSVQSELKKGDGTVIMRSKYNASAEDEKCGPERMKKIASHNSLARPLAGGAASKWGGHLQPQMETIRLKFNPSGSTALGISHILKNRHAAGMCLLQEAAAHNPADPYAPYNQAVILEAFGVYGEARELYGKAETHPDFQKGRWNDGRARSARRIKHMKLMEKAYDMVSAPTAFPHAESCPEVDRSDTQTTAKRTTLHDSKGGNTIRRLHEGEALRVLSEDKKWKEVQQLDGTVGWVKDKDLFE
ncbi:MAG: hypothetical protein CL927_16915 [Deltaproteobacteria bacterium]|nr:hypothetical protein [Deltaproteobacteria bacterium]HCH61438.1 hypothetical protein [Deltaproteobacteria bacterium]